jgi:hypothetical protein
MFVLRNGLHLGTGPLDPVTSCEAAMAHVKIPPRKQGSLSLQLMQQTPHFACRLPADTYSLHDGVCQPEDESVPNAAAKADASSLKSRSPHFTLSLASTATLSTAPFSYLQRLWLAYCFSLSIQSRFDRLLIILHCMTGKGKPDAYLHS